MNDPLTILVVDDEEKIRDGCRRVLTGQGYEVLTAENGRVALDILDGEAVDVLLLDLKMPLMDGEKVLECVSDSHPDIPVIIITGHGTLDTAVDCMKKGAYDFVTKPFQIKHFMASINRAAEKRRLEQTARRVREENERNLYDLGLEKSRLKAVINCLANGVMVTNRNLEVVLHNPALMRMMNINADVPAPAPLSDIVTLEAIADTLRRIQRGEVSMDEFISQEISIGRQHLRAISAPAPGPDRSVAGTVTVIEDVTGFKQLDKMKSDFINMVAHELRSPLHSVKQLLTVQLEGLCGGISEKQEDYLGRSVRQIDSLLELIKDLLDISRAEAGAFVQHQAPVDLEEILSKVVSVMEARAAAQGIRVEVSVQDVKPVQADPKSMEEVLGNLLSNAVNYSPDGGIVRVRLTGVAGNMEILVSDDGVGIPLEEQSRIFDKFYRVKDPKTRQVVGSGLGLSLVKSIVETHRGMIEVDSAPGQGATFRVVLPVLQ